MPKAIDVHVHAPYELQQSDLPPGSKLAEIAEAAASSSLFEVLFGWSRWLPIPEACARAFVFMPTTS